MDLASLLYPRSILTHRGVSTRDLSTLCQPAGVDQSCCFADGQASLIIRHELRASGPIVTKQI